MTRRPPGAKWQVYPSPREKTTRPTGATPAQKARLGKLAPEAVRESKLAGEPITAKPTRAAVGGLKAVAAGGWFAARPSGTENVYKIYAESFKGPDHLSVIVSEAQQIVSAALRSR